MRPRGPDGNPHPSTPTLCTVPYDAFTAETGERKGPAIDVAGTVRERVWMLHRINQSARVVAARWDRGSEKNTLTTEDPDSRSLCTSDYITVQLVG